MRWQRAPSRTLDSCPGCHAINHKRAMLPSILLPIVFVTSTVLAAAERSEDRWNLGDMYPSVKAWQDDAAKLEAQLKSFAGCRGKLGESPQRLKSCLDAYADFTKRFARLETYSSQLLAEDTGSAESLELQDKARHLGAEREQAISFLKPEILRLGRAKVEALLKEDRSPSTAITWTTSYAWRRTRSTRRAKASSRTSSSRRAPPARPIRSSPMPSCLGRRCGSRMERRCYWTSPPTPSTARPTTATTARRCSMPSGASGRSSSAPSA